MTKNTLHYCFCCYCHHLFITLPVGAVAKYCDEYVCLCVCGSLCLPVREDISGTTRTIFTKFFMHVACVRGLILLQCVDDRLHRIPLGIGFLPHLQYKGKGKGFPILDTERWARS